MKIFLLEVDFTKFKREPWGSTIAAVVRSESEESAFKMIEDDFRSIPKEFWLCTEIPQEGEETMFIYEDYGNI